MDPMTAVSSYSQIANPATGRSAKEVAEGFEGLFLFQMLEPLEKSSEALFGKGPEGRTFSGLFRQMLADQVASARPLGIADRIESAIEQQQNGKIQG
ncbi:MAG: rod-binding protein [Planctomycetota bacterium]